MSQYINTAWFGTVHIILIAQITKIKLGNNQINVNSESKYHKRKLIQAKPKMALALLVLLKTRKANKANVNFY